MQKGPILLEQRIQPRIGARCIFSLAVRRERNSRLREIRRIAPPLESMP